MSGSFFPSWARRSHECAWMCVYEGFFCLFFLSLDITYSLPEHNFVPLTCMFKSKLSLNPFLQSLKLDGELCWLACNRPWVLSHKSLPDLHTCSAFMPSSPVILAWSLKSPEPASSKVFWILSTGSGFVQASQFMGSSESSSTAAEHFPSTKKAIIRERSMSGDSHGRLLTNNCEELNY